jgi:hypothetical protein
MVVSGSYKNGLARRYFCKYHCEEGYMINQCEGFCNKMIQMLIRGTFRIERETGKELSMIDEPRKQGSLLGIINCRRIAQTNSLKTYNDK